MTANKPLPEKYSKALNLIKEGNLSYREIAKVCKINEDNLYELCEGNYTEAPQIQEKFTNALNEINKQRDKEIRDLLKKCKKKTLRLIDSYLSNFNQVTPKQDKLMSTLTAVANALAKSTPNVEIGSVSYTQGLSAEDIIHEFNRLTAAAFDRRRLQPSNNGGAGQLPGTSGQNRITPEESEDTIL
jgi:hypothetical protein